MTLRTSAMLSTKLDLCLPEINIAVGGAPVAATLTRANGSNGSVTFTSLKGQDIGNASSVTLTFDTNAASVSLSGYAVTVKLHSSDSNASNIDTTASNVKTLMDANSNIAGLFATTTNTAGVMTSAVKAFLTGGNDKLTVVSTGSVSSIVRNSVGNYTLTLADNLNDASTDPFFGHVDTFADSLASLSGIAKVDAQRASANTVTLGLINFSGALADVSNACHIRGLIVGHQLGVKS